MAAAAGPPQPRVFEPFAKGSSPFVLLTDESDGARMCGVNVRSGAGPRPMKWRHSSRNLLRSYSPYRGSLQHGTLSAVDSSNSFERVACSLAATSHTRFMTRFLSRALMLRVS